MAQFNVYSSSVENIISIKSNEVTMSEIQQLLVRDATKVRDMMNFLYNGITYVNDPQANLTEKCIPNGFMEMDIFDYKVFLGQLRNLMAQYRWKYYEGFG